MQWHDENYYAPWDAEPVCGGCHKILHNRWKLPDAWNTLALRAAERDEEGEWALRVSMDPQNDYAMECRQAYGVEARNFFWLDDVFGDVFPWDQLHKFEGQRTYVREHAKYLAGEVDI